MASEIKLPALGENVTGGDVLEIKVAVGDTVVEGQTLLEVQAEKSTVEVPAPAAGRIEKILVKSGQAVKVGQALCLLDSTGQATKTPPEAKKEEPKTAPMSESKPAAPEPPRRLPAPASIAPLPTSTGTIHAGPATRHLARELGLDLAQVRGSARGGRITQEDVKAFVRDLAAGAGTGGLVGATQAPALPDFSKWGQVEKKPLGGIRKKTAEQMALAWNLIPHVTQHDFADITDLEAFRRQGDGKATKLTVTAFALKSVAIALKLYPQFNVSLDMAGNQIIQKQYIHIGVAVDTEAGLVVPVIRNVDQKSVLALAAELTECAEKARQRKLTIDDMRGGCFTITNLGGIGGTGFTPIVNWPEVAILGLSRSRLEPSVKDGAVVPRLLLPLSLSYDHRVIDGANAARFTRRIADMLENPLSMLLHA